MKLKNIGNRLKDENLDLSLCDLDEVPVEEIATVRKLTYLDLSNNFLVTLPNNFVILKQILKLDLSKNMLTEIPENFGEMTQLKYLDLYANQISRLPLSLSELKNLRWLDLKENPLTPSVASIAGPCNNAEECKNCARNVVEYLNNVKRSVEEEKLRRLNAKLNKMSVVANKDNDNDTTKKESKKKKKKKHTDKEVEKNLNKNKSEVECKVSENIEDKMDSSKETFNEQNQKHCISAALCRILTSLFLWTVMFGIVFGSLIIILPLYNKELSYTIMDYIEKHTGIFLKTYQRYGTELLQNKSQILMKWMNHACKTINDIYNGYNLTDII
ncbi:leucine-rich repeat-containing protein 59-like [Vespa mandarinia]|uniref:leucine-rich repeat-containing protein 59-like n=1 Tax=Vespa mandarinia TaxID=7446 RepID=UPI001612F66D|nr:leucine-rich repeat-containing protein 59-like [Vespa mandarinia]XP_035720021.1 leucine-rich repeat-containing protein 59-like [Vespa mandarinia]XP_035720022.1 leucine-rich repeat-containing protein 59-like [Vespa mandarinia]